MTNCTKRLIACVLAVALLFVCVLSGITLAASAAATSPIIQNGDLEDGAVSGWEGASAYVKEGVGYNGTWGLHFDFQGWARVNYTSAENWALEPHSTYRLTYLAKGQPLCAYFGTKTDVSGFSVSSGSKVLDGQWCTRVAYFTTGAAPSVKNMYFGRTSGSTVGDSYVDNIVIEKVDKNLDRIVNGDMEIDSICFWNAMGNTGLQYVNDPVEGGTHGRVLTFTKAGQGYYNLIRYTKGRTFKLSFDHYGEGMSFFIADIIDIDKTGWQRVPAHDEWTRYEFVFSTHNMDGVETSGDAAMYSFCFENGLGAYIDNMSLMEMPCVESIAMSETELSLTPGRTAKLSYTLTPDNVDVQGGALTFATSDPDVVTVDQQGNIRAVGKAGTTAVITVSNPCLSASCTVNVTEEDKAVVAFMDKSGVGAYAVTNKNYDALIGAEADWNALTDAQRARVAELLPAGRNYPDLLAVAKTKQAELAAEFVHHYAYNSANLPITEATFSTCLWIATAKDEWTAMSASTKAVVNEIALDACGITFEQLYNESVALVPVTDPDDRPGANGGGSATDQSAADGVTVNEFSGTVSVTGSRILLGIVSAIAVAVLLAVALVLRYRRRGVRVLSLLLVFCLSMGFVCVVPITTKAWSLTNDWIDVTEDNTITDFAYSIAVVGDTQVITDKYPDDLAKIYDWILANKESKKIGFVAGLGDITETNAVAQWDLARAQIMKLQGVIPFSLTEGNHDNGNGSTANMNAAFPVAEVFAGYAPGTYGVFEEGLIDNTYQLFEINGIKYMMLALEFGPRPEVLAWAGELCDQYYDRNVILTTHAYLDGDANIMDENSAGSPHLKGGYETTYGTTIWNDLITTHDNIILAMSGHVSADNFKVKQEVGKYGQVVTNLVSNPQTIDAQIKPSGMVTMLYFSADGQTMTVQDYSTIQEQFYGDPVTVTVDKAQHRHKASTDVFSSDAVTHWYVCECGGKAEEAPHAWSAWEVANATEQERLCVFCGYTERITLGDMYVEVDLHRANFKLFSYDETNHWLNCDCEEDNIIHQNAHSWTAWKQTGTLASSGTSIFTDDVPFTSTPFTGAVEITESAGTINPAEDTLAAELGDELAAELKANIIADFEKDGDKMVHVSSFTIVDDVVYMTYYANTATAGEDASHLEARFAYCPLSDPDDMTVMTVQKTGDTLEGRSITKVYDTILMNKNDGKIYVMWTAATTQYYRFYAVFDIATKTLGDIGVNRFKCGDIVNDMSISGIRSALINNGYSTKYMSSDIGIMQKLSAREENGEIWYYTGMYCWQFNCIIKSKDLITWEFVAMPDFDNRSEYENATYVIGDKVYYFVRQFDGTNGTKDPYGFLTYYDLEAKTWATPVLVNDCQSRSDFFHYGGELYLVHAPVNRNGIGLLKIDQENLANSKVVAVADMGTISGGSCFYPYTMVYGDTLYLSYTVIREHIRLAKCDLTNYLPKNGDSIVLPAADPDVSVDDTVKEEAEHDTDIWERFCPCGASERQLLPMGMPMEENSDQNLIEGQIDGFTMAASSADVHKTAKAAFKAGTRYVLRIVSRGADGKVTLLGSTLNLKKTDDWRAYQLFFTPTANADALDITFHHNGATTNAMMLANVQILEAPTDGSFNLFAGSSLNTEPHFFAFDGDGGDGPYVSGNGYNTVDPTDPTNTVLRINNNTSNIFVLNDAWSGYTLPENCMIEITFRRTGANVILRQGWGTTYSCSTNDAAKGTAANEWLTYTWYVDPADFNNGKEWMNLSSNMYYGKGTYADSEAYIDDIVIRERPFAESFSFKGDTIKVDAKSGVQDLGDQLVVSPPNALPSTLTWSITGNTTKKYVESTGLFEGDDVAVITLNGSSATVADLGSDGGMNTKWSLANCTPTITVESAEGLKATAPVEWVYPETVFHVDVDTNASGRTDAYEITDPNDPTNRVMSVPTANEFTVYFTEKDIFLKPNARYLLSYRSKATQGDNGRIYAYLTCSTDIYQQNTTKRASLVCSNTTSDWITNTMLIETGAAPSADSAYSLMLQRYGSGTNNILVDDIKLEMVPDDYTMIVGGDFEMESPTIAYYDKLLRSGFGTVVQDGDNSVLKLKAGVGRSTSTSLWGLEYLKKNTVYQVKFRQKGGKVVFHVAGGDGWASTICNVGNPDGTYAATDTWETRSFYFATGDTITNNGNWSSTVQLGTGDADVYLDDIEFIEMKTGAMVKAVENTANRGGSITIAGGGWNGKLLPTVKAGDTVTVTLKPSTGYLVDPSTITYTDRSGAVHPILNNPTPMTDTKNGGTGYVFAFAMPEDCISIDATFVSAATDGFQWGTLGSALHVDTDGNVDGLRFLNRLYISGLDWSADELTVTYGGTQYYVQELGAIARPEATDGSGLTLANDTLSGVCYKRGNSLVRVTDYTDAYLDFTVVIMDSEKTPITASYECCAYMTLTAVDNAAETVTLYTDSITDSANTVLTRMTAQ